MKKSINVVGVISIVTLTCALVIKGIGGNNTLLNAFGLLATISILVLLTLAYLVGGELDKTSQENHPIVLRLHFLFHIVPLTYFLVVLIDGESDKLKILYIVPMVFFFITGTKAWKLLYKLLNIKLFELFRIGNLQMIFIFPAALILELLRWPSHDGHPFSDIINGYFAAHFVLAGVAIPMMNNGLIKYKARAEKTEI